MTTEQLESIQYYKDLGYQFIDMGGTQAGRYHFIETGKRIASASTADEALTKMQSHIESLGGIAA